MVMSLRVENGARKTLDHAPDRSRQFQLVMSRFARTGGIGVPGRQKGGGVVTSLWRSTPGSSSKLAESPQVLRAEPEELCEACIGEANPARRIEENDADLNGIKHAAKFGMHVAPFLLRALDDGAFFQAEKEMLGTGQYRAQGDADGKSAGE